MMTQAATMKKVFSRTEGLTKPMRYCPGCGHGVVHRLVAEVLVELGVLHRSIAVASVGCSVFVDEYFNCDATQVAHGRAPAVATGIKRSKPDCIVFTYQGDGDLASIGMAETIHSAARNENITIVFINNAIFGMTGGQMAPTTLPGMVSSTSPKGRDVKKAGYPIKTVELLNALDGPTYLARTTVGTPKHVLQTRKAIKKAFQCQIDGLGFGLVEVVSNCPTDWGMDTTESIKFLQEKMIPYYPLGEVRVPDALADKKKAK
jgi:2-oxoglutarate ferredoxin oxidoreductase subunit beta